MSCEKIHTPLGWDNEGSIGAKKVMGVRKTKFGHEEEEEEEEEEEDAVGGLGGKCYAMVGI